jgi:hypothetical protein
MHLKHDCSTWKRRKRKKRRRRRRRERYQHEKTHCRFQQHCCCYDCCYCHCDSHYYCCVFVVDVDVV